MTLRLRFGPLVAAALLLACTEGAGPSSDMSPSFAAVSSDTEPNFLAWEDPDSVAFTADGAAVDLNGLNGARDVLDYAMGGQDGGAGGVIQDLVVIGSGTNEVRFWAVRGEARSLSVNYIDGDGVERPFILFMVGPDALFKRPDGSVIARGDSVEITLIANTSQIRVQLEPTGLQFAKKSPADLTMWYTGAGADLNGDGVVDAADDAIQSQLGMWYQEGETAPWLRLDAWHDAQARWLSVLLEHFSGYSISY